MRLLHSTSIDARSPECFYATIIHIASSRQVSAYDIIGLAMIKIVPHLVNANGRLDEFVQQINKATKMAEEYAFPKLEPVRSVNIVFSDAFRVDIIPETHIGGHTYLDDFIAVTIDSNSKGIRADDIFLTICHELCHAIRWQYNDEWSATLLDGMVFEGLATAFEIEAARDNGVDLDFFAKTIVKRTDKDNRKIANILSEKLYSQVYNYNLVFFTGNEAKGLPRWSGYSLGYYIVREYSDKHGKGVSDIFKTHYSDFVSFVKNDC